MALLGKDGSQDVHSAPRDLKVGEETLVQVFDVLRR